MVKEKGADALELAGPYINLGNCYKRMQKLDDAERCYREAMRLHQANDRRERRTVFHHSVEPGRDLRGAGS